MDRLTLLAGGGVDVATIAKTIRRVPPDAASGAVAVAHEVSVAGVAGTGTLTASLDAGEVQDLDGLDLPAAARSGVVDIQLA